MWLGYLEEFPDYMTQGRTSKELRENLGDIYRDLSAGHIPHVRKVGTPGRMRRVDLIRQMEKNGCVLIRHGGRHDWYQNRKRVSANRFPAIAN